MSATTPPVVEPFHSLGLVGDSRAMQRLRADVLRYGPRSAPVLVLGETGSGKELVARALHLISSRARAPFVAVNVATLRGDLVASELFGHERGAFTGSVQRHRGLFEQAHGGTLFLDELGELDPRAQADLLRVLENGEVRPLGSDRPRVVDVRLVAATHRDLAEMVAGGTFRADLYYRLHVLPVAMPSLRERPEDVAALVAHLLAKLHHEVGERQLTDRALAMLAQHTWPGNVRQLSNVLHRVIARSDDTVLVAEAVHEALSVEPRQSRGRSYRVRASVPVSTTAVREAMGSAGGNISAAARSLGIARSTLRDRVSTDRSVTTPTHAPALEHGE